MTWLALGLCLLVSFVFTGIEAGLLSLNPARLHARVRVNDPAATKLEALLAHPGRLLATVLLVTNFGDVVALVLIADGLVRRLGSPRGYWVALGLLLPIYLVGVQMVPRFLFRRFPFRALAALAGVLETARWLLSPLLVLGNWITRLLDPPGGDGAQAARGVFVAREELKNLATEGERAGALSSAERGMIHTVVDFRGVRARDVMRPLPEAFRLDPGTGHGGRVGELLEFALARGLDCLPVVRPAAGNDERAGAASDELVALLDVFVLLLERDTGRQLLATAVGRRAPVLVRPEDPVYGIIRRLRTARTAFAAVVEDNRPLGLVRSRDIVQRLARGAAG